MVKSKTELAPFNPIDHISQTYFTLQICKRCSWNPYRGIYNDCFSADLPPYNLYVVVLMRLFIMPTVCLNVERDRLLMRGVALTPETLPLHIVSKSLTLLNGFIYYSW